MDSRFHLKVEFEIYGKKFRHDCSLNWHNENGDIDRRIVEMFRDWHDEAYAEWIVRNEPPKKQERLFSESEILSLRDGARMIDMLQNARDFPPPDTKVHKPLPAMSAG